MLKLYDMLRKSSVGRAFIRFIKFLLKLCPFIRDIEAEILQTIVYRYTFGKIKFRGQFFQDAIAYLYLNMKNDGFYIDIGANDGITGSNTYALEQAGWKGVCIEPQPDIFKKLKHFRKCDCYNAAVASVHGENMEFLKVNNDFNALSGFDGFITDEHKKTIHESGSSVERLSVNTVTFDEIMGKYPGVTTIDFMSLDVEGYEMNILNSIDFSKYSFRFITVEENGKEKEISALMTKNGYSYLMRAGVDLMFVPHIQA
jgi:FkbM family methyltransferase